MYVGIDVSKGKSRMCIVDENEKVLKAFDFKHDKKGFEKVESHLTDEMKIGLETTGNYSTALYQYFKQKYKINCVTISK